MIDFLTTLPAILGIVGFVIYLIIKKSASEDPIIKSILEKLKYEEPSFYQNIEKLSDSEKIKVLKTDYQLREKISEVDRKILDKSLTNQFRTNIFVYSLCVVLLIFGIYLYSKPKALNIDSIEIQNTGNDDSDMIVDIDPIKVTWTSTGKDSEVFIVLENIGTGKQSKRYRALASDGFIIFKSNDFHNYDKILDNRFPNESNRIRAIIYSNNESFKSKPFEVKVGVKIICYPEQPNILVFNAIIDQYIIENFHFAPKIALFKDTKFNGRKIFSSSQYQPKPHIKIEQIENFVIDNFVLNVNPRDLVNNNVYRTDIESLKVALLELKNGE